LLKARWTHCNEIRSALREIMEEGRNAEYTVKKYTASPNKGSKDRKFIAEAVFGIIKNFRYYSFISPETDDPYTGELLAYLITNNILPPNGEEWSRYPRELTESKIREADFIPGVRYSMPQWLDELGMSQLPHQWEDIRKVSVEKAPVYIRVNNLLANVRKVSGHLSKKGIEHTIENEHCIRLIDRLNVQTDNAYLNGWFEIQDMGSQSVAVFCNPLPGQAVIDACAGAGGKTLHLADLMHNEGNILALDVNEKALEQLKIRARRAQASIIAVSNYSDPQKILDLDDSADLVLCDVPCNATGVMRREIDQKWKLSPEKLEELLHTQIHILDRASSWVVPGGHLVYATCSVLPQENHEQIRAFLQKHPDYKLIEEKQLFPVHNGHDGFYMCRMQRS